MLTPTARARWAGLLAVAAGTLLAAGGCGASAPKGTPVSGTASPATRASASDSPAGAAQVAARSALAAYADMWKEMQVAGMTANWKDPRLATYASGAALHTLVTGLYDDHKQGLIVKGTLVIKPRVTSEKPSGNPDLVVITDCTDDSHWLNYVAATGKLQNNVPGGHRLVEAAVTKLADHWTVSQLAVHAEGTC